MHYESLTLEIANGIAVVTLARSEKFNSLDLVAARELFEVSNHLFDRADVRVVLLTGSGDKAFCAGGDVAAFASQPDRAGQLLLEITGYLHTAISRFASMPAPIVVGVNGVAAGAGLGLVAAADLAIASERARFTSAYTQIGLTPDAGTSYFLSRIVGIRRATELFLLNRQLSASEALSWGLLNSVVAHDELPNAAHQLAAKLASGPTAAFAGVKNLIRNGLSETLASQLEQESSWISRMAMTADGLEGVRSFIERRKPMFQGR